MPMTPPRAFPAHQPLHQHQQPQQLLPSPGIAPRAAALPVHDAATGATRPASASAVAPATTDTASAPTALVSPAAAAVTATGGAGLPAERELWLRLCQFMQRLDDCHRSCDVSIAKINKIHAKLTRTDKFNIKVAQKLIESYNDVLSRTAMEKKSHLKMVRPPFPVRIIAEWVEKADILMALTEAAETGLETKRKKRKHEEKHGTSISKRSKTDEHTEPVGLLSPGAQVVVPRPAQQDFILAIVVRWIAEKQKYEVEDAEDDEENPGTRRCYLFPSKMVIPLPKAAATREFPDNHIVLALYPGTSCFYRATVITPPSKMVDEDYAGLYAVRFEDDGGFDRYIDPKVVLDYPKHTQRTGKRKDASAVA
ncbi:hypothetical protein HK405_014013 [Cladochytrium tenue]|nr:hypothetical protein HK405_014013 [Cladochytrium tenue]